MNLDRITSNGPSELIEFTQRHPSTYNLLKWLAPSPAVRAQGGPAADAANLIYDTAISVVESCDQDSPELTTGLRKLLEAKDCFVRAALDEKPGFWTDR